MPLLDTTPAGAAGRPEPSILRMLKDLRDDALTLGRQEIALAKREMTSKATRLGRNTAFFGISALTALYGLFFVLLSLNNLIFAGLDRAGFSGAVANWFAPVLVGMMLLVVALALMLKALRAMRKARTVPERTVATLREDKEWLKRKIP